MKITFKSVVAASMVILASSVVFAQEAATHVAAATGADWRSLGALGAFLGLGMAALGGTLGQSRVAASAMEGIARNPQARAEMFVPFILALALIESLVVLAFLAVVFVNGKLV
jgi:F-type H+-transporting ATPase subunit c